MKLIICSVRDRAADVFGQPFYTPALGQAIRSFSDEINRADEKSTLFNHPEDFDLYELGSYNDADASFELLEKPRQVAVGKDLSRKEV